MWVDLRDLPAWPRIGNHEDEQGSCGGITILSSVPSYQVPTVLACSLSQFYGRTDPEPLDDADHQSLASSLTSLSRSATPASGAAPASPTVHSLLAHWFEPPGESMHSFHALSRTSSLSNISSLLWTVTSEDSLDDALPPPASSDTDHPVHQHWYEGLRSEHDWENLQRDMRSILDVLRPEQPGDESLEELLARLVEEEERLLWNHQRSPGSGSRMRTIFQRLQNQGWVLFGEALLVAATMSALGTTGTET